jgi:hypothetical protein
VYILCSIMEAAGLRFFFFFFFFFFLFPLFLVGEQLMDIDSDSDEEFDDEGEVDMDDGKFERHVVQLPNISGMSKEGEAERNSRLVDCAVLFGVGEEDEEDDEDDEDEREGDEEEKQAAPTDQEAKGEEPSKEIEENEIDGVPFELRTGHGGHGGRKSLHSVIEAMQSKAGLKAPGYDQTDAFIDDEEAEAESVAGLLETEGKKPYRYDDFRVSVDFDVASKDKSAKGGQSGQGNQQSQQKKKTLKPLKDLNPPASDELKAAIQMFREVAKANQEQFTKQAQEKKVFMLPDVLVAPLTRLGQAIQAWHPSKHLKEEMFEYVADVLPPNIVNLKNKAKRLMGGTTPKING